MYHYSKISASLLLLALTLGCVCGATIYPKSLQTKSGTASTTPVSALSGKDQSGSDDKWEKYVEFYGSNKAYQGTFSFDVSGINAASVASFTLDTNFRGPAKSGQAWNFEYLVPASNSYVLAGDNTNAASWAWSALSFPSGSVKFSDLVKDGTVSVRFSSGSVSDDCDLDYLAITTTEGTVAATPATPAPTAAPTSKATPAPTHKATSAPTSKATPAPTQKATPAPTQKATPAPTTKATPAPTTKATPAPTTKATPAPTTKATPAPTSKATPAPTTKATSPGGRICPAGQVWAPAPGTTWQWQLTGTIDTSLDVQMYDIDLFDATTSVISTLHSQGKAVICYFSTQYEDWRPDSASWPASVLGHALDGWPGENWVDIRSPVLRSLITARLDLAVTKGCDGVEPDNVDEYTNTNGLGITAADQINFNTFVAAEAHKRGLSVGLKNDLDQITSLVSQFDWHLDEQCNEYGECDYLKPFVTAGKAAFGVDYTGSASNICPKMATAKNSWLIKDLDLSAKVTQCCTAATGGCASKPAHRCVSYATKRSELGEEVVELVDEAEVVAEEQNLADATFEADYAAEHSAASTTMFSAAIVGVVAVASLVL